jgi:hypothetical protein
VTEARPAFYALARGGWRDYVTLLHPPYTLWHLSYVAIGAALAPHFDGGLLALTALAFFLALGVGAHALDELHGRPLETQIPRWALLVLATVTIAAAAAIGVAVAVDRDLWLIPFVAFGTFVVVAYNLELFGGILHNDLTFALTWGAFPLVTAYFVSAETIRVEAALAAAFAALLSHAQRLLSTRVRELRRHVTAVSGTMLLDDGGSRPLDRETLLRTPEQTLRVLAAAVVALALALVAFRVT